MADGTLVGLTKALAWPVTTFIALLVFHDSLNKFFGALSNSLRTGRSVKLGAAGISIELGAASTETDKSVAPIMTMPFAAEASAFTSAGDAYFHALVQGDAVEAVTINLGSGKEFLTDRLFATVALMARQRDLLAVAFVRTEGVREDVYLGTCLVDDLRRALVSSFPEYEAALAMAVHQVWWMRSPGIPAPPVIQGMGPWNSNFPPGAEFPIPALDTRGRLPVDVAVVVVGAFLEALQCRGVAPVPGQLPPARWVWLDQPSVYERAEWVTAQWLRERLGPALSETRVCREGNAPGKLVQRVVESSGNYVGLVDEAGRLQELISRMRLLEQVSRANSTGTTQEPIKSAGP
jgi:hypothetical protein